MFKTPTLCFIVLLSLFALSLEAKLGQQKRSGNPVQKQLQNFQVFKGTFQQFDDSILKGTTVAIFANQSDEALLSAVKSHAEIETNLRFQVLYLSDYVDLLPFYSAQSSTVVIVFRDGNVVGEFVPQTPVTSGGFALQLRLTLSK